MVQVWSAQFLHHLLHGSAEQAELIAFRVGEDHPGHIRPLADVDPPGAEILEPLELGLEARPISPHVDVESALDLVGLGRSENVELGEVPGPATPG